MEIDSQKEVHSARVVNAPIELVYQAFANPLHLKEWWGPAGFTNTIHEFDLQPEGRWILTMHGPEKGNYENSSIFKIVVPNKQVAWTRLSQPLFDMEISFEPIDATTARISFRMIFSSKEECDKMKKFVVPNNEENFDRLETLLTQILDS